MFAMEREIRINELSISEFRISTCYSSTAWLQQPYASETSVTNQNFCRKKILLYRSWHELPLYWHYFTNISAIIIGLWFTSYNSRKVLEGCLASRCIRFDSYHLSMDFSHCFACLDQYFFYFFSEDVGVTG